MKLACFHSLGRNRGPLLVAGHLSSDPLRRKAWRISEPVPFPGAPATWFNPKFASESDQYLEPNVIDVNGQLRVLCTGKIKPPENRQRVRGARGDG